jgi:uncharacterized membrane protein
LILPITGTDSDARCLQTLTVFGQSAAVVCVVPDTGARHYPAVYGDFSSVVAVNATVVICLQYIVGKRITNEYLNQWLTAGFSLFLLGVVGFALSTTVLHWALAVAIFTVGEIIVFPAEYMFIDRIAPDHLRVYLPSKKRGLFDLNDDLAL